MTFAGSPDRVEARLVPEAGYELDTFAISGFPRQPIAGARLARSTGPGVAPPACRAILRRRRRDVVFGGGGYVAGPMVLAAASMRIPAALVRGRRPPRPREPARAAVREARLPRLPARRGWTAPRYRVVGRPIPARARAHPAGARRARSSSCRRTARCCSSPARSRARARSTSWSIEAFGEVGPAILHISGERDYGSLKSRVRRDDYRLIPSTERIGAAYSAADLVLARAGSSVWEIAAAGKPAILVPYPFATADHQAKNAEYFVQRGRRDHGARPRPRRRARPRPLAARRPASGSREMSEAMLRVAQARRGRGDRRGADRACGRLRGAGSGSSGSAAPGLSAYAQLAARLGRRGRRLGPRRDAVPRAARRRRRSRSRPSRSCRTAGRWSSRRRTRASPGAVARRVPRRARRAAARRSSSRGTHGKGTTAAMIAFVLRETGRDPAWLIGAPVPQLGSNAGAGEGWLVVEGDESDRTVFGLPAEIAVVTNVELDHHSEFARSPSSRPSSTAGPARRRTSFATRRRSRGRSRCRASTTARTRARRSPRSSSPASAADEAAAALGRFTGTGRRFEVSEAGGVTIVDDYAPSPGRDRGDDRRRARGVPGPAAARALPAAPRLAHAAPRASSSARRSPPPTTWSSPTSTWRGSPPTRR